MARAIICHNGDQAWVDEEDWEKVQGFLWFSTRIGVFRKEPDSPWPRSVYLHRTVMGEPPGHYIGFLDDDKKNCQKANLFLFTPGSKRAARAAALARLGKGSS